MADEVAALITSINKKLKRDVLVRGRDLIYERVPRISSGSLAFDAMLGGGWPLNQWNEIIGEESAGKTTVLFKTIAANMDKDPRYTVMWIAAEEFVPSWAEACGVDLERVILARTNAMEEAYTAVDETIASQHVDCIVIDSLPALVPDEEAEKSFNDWQIGLGARLTGKMFRKTTSSGKRSLVDEERPWIGFVVNQWREKVGVQYGDNRTTPGGLAKNYFYFTRVEVRRDGWLTEDGLVGGVKIGLTIKARTVKNKTFPPGKTAAVDFYFDDYDTHTAGQFDTGKEVANLALALDVVMKKGNTYYFEGEKIGVGRDNTALGIRNNPELLQRVWDTTINATLIKYGMAVSAPSTNGAKPRRKLVRKSQS